MTEVQTQPESVVPDALTTVLLGHNAFQFTRAGVELGLFDLLERSPGTPRERIGAELGLAERSPGHPAARRDLAAPGGAHRGGVRQREVHLGPVHRRALGTRQGGRRVRGVRHLSGPGGLHRVPAGQQQHRAAALPGGRRHGLPPAERGPRTAEGLLPLHGHLVGRGQQAPHQVRRLPAPPGASLDVGGGDATMAMAVADAHPDVEVTVLEIPKVVELARKRVAEAGLDDRVKVVEGDIFAGDYPGGPRHRDVRAPAADLAAGPHPGAARPRPRRPARGRPGADPELDVRGQLRRSAHGRPGSPSSSRRWPARAGCSTPGRATRSR
ncbi:hypothetical protein LT493_05470 [Streptomyces tricolor]|nr:hypothetical protein [Streptomyces tricolor]